MITVIQAFEEMPRLTRNSLSTTLTTSKATFEPPVEGTNTPSNHLAVPTAGPVTSTSVGPIVPHSSSTVQAASSGFPPQLLASTVSTPLTLQSTLRTPLADTRVTEAPAFLPTFVPPSVSQLYVPGDFVVILFMLAIARYFHYASRTVCWTPYSNYYVKQYPSSIFGASVQLLHRALCSWPRFYPRLSQTGQQHCEGSICRPTSPDSRS